jgi:glyoxylase-like metal-dependent hydrolase (beta-lactamase superfamily II)
MFLHREAKMNGLAMVLTGVLFCLMLPGTGFAQQQAALAAEEIADNVYIVTGGVANTGFVVGDKEVLAIDAEMTADQGKQMIAEIRKVTSKPLTKIILTHSDGDHVSGLSGFPPGLEIISGVKAKEEMAADIKAQGNEELQPYLPTRTFTDKMVVELAPERIQLLHFGPAHTSGDIVVFFPERKLAFVGDLVFIGRDPLIHRHKGGSSSGLIKTLQGLLALDADRYVPGHNNIITKSDIEPVLKNLQEKQEKVKALVQEGKSLEEAKEAFGIVDPSAKPGGGGYRFLSLVETIYLELSEK